MKLRLVAGIAAALSFATAVAAQTTSETKMSTDTSTKAGVATTKTKMVHTRKTRTHHPRKVLGVKIGHKTITHKTVKETSTSSNGDTSTTVKTQ